MTLIRFDTPYLSMEVWNGLHQCPWLSHTSSLSLLLAAGHERGSTRSHSFASSLSTVVMKKGSLEKPHAFARDGACRVEQTQSLLHENESTYVCMVLV
jgi:hypothetical protein